MKKDIKKRKKRLQKEKDSNKLKTLEKVAKKNLNAILRVLPMFLAIIFLIGLIKSYSSSKLNYSTHNIVLDGIIYNTLGSIFAGNAINSYLIADEMLKAGLSLYAALIFVLAWVTVGLVQYPAESMILGKDIAFWRNLIAYLTNFIVAFIVVLITSNI